MKLSTNQQRVLDYLKLNSHHYVSPTEIGNKVGGKTKGYYGEYLRHSSWASPICLKLCKLGLVERNEKGWYKIK